MVCLVRTIYYMMLPSGYMRDVIAGIFVDLPTFIFFSAFSVLYYMWAYLRLIFSCEKEELDVKSKKLRKILYILNLFMYLIFIIIVSTFYGLNIYANNDDATQCIASFQDENGINTGYAARNAVAIVFKLFISLLALILGVFSYYYGRRVITVVSHHDESSLIREFPKVKERQNLMKQSTLICSLSFILHSIFLTVFAITYVTTIAMIVLMQLVEVIPALAMLYFLRPKLKRSVHSTTHLSVFKMLKSSIRSDDTQPTGNMDYNEALLSSHRSVYSEPSDNN